MHLSSKLVFMTYIQVKPVDSFLIVLFALLLIQGCVNNSDSDRTFDGGNGTEANPFQISTIDQLQAIDDPVYLDKHFIQVSDIDASPSAEFQHGSGFKHIGDRETPFTGSYNGNGFVIRDLHLHIQRSSDQHTGIFGMIQSARLENITVDNSEQLERVKSEKAKVKSDPSALSTSLMFTLRSFTRSCAT